MITLNVWIPKKAVVRFSSMAEVDTYFRRKKAEEMARFDAGVERYNKMISFAKENGLKVRKGMRKETILQKIAAAGLEYTY